MPRTMPTSFGILLRQHRIQAGLTQEELAERARLSERAVSDLERGGNRTPRVHTVRQLAHALQLSPAEQQVLLDASRFAEPVNVGEDGGRVNAPVGDDSFGTHSARTPEVSLDQPEQQLPVGGFLGAMPSGPLVAREQELARILSLAELVQPGQGRLVALAGEAGVGKTRLAQEVSLILRERGFLVAAGSCYEAQQATPYFPFLDLLTVLYHRAPDDLRATVPDRFPYLPLLLPDQHLPVPVPAREGTEDQERLFWSVVGFIRAWSERQPLALLLDDVHWSDRSSLELVLRLARHTRGHPVLLVVTYRDVEVGRRHPLQATLRELTRQELLERIPVRHLSEEGTARLVATVFNEQGISDAFSSLLYERTEGNPFLVQQVLRVLVESGDFYREEGRWTRKALHELEVPESIRLAVGQRVDRLSEEAQQILGEASVLGQTFHFDDLVTMSEHEERRIDEALEEVLQMGLIRAGERDQYAFDHALTQQALYSELSARRRRTLHLAAGTALEQLQDRKRRGRVAELAWHFQQGDDPERALRYAMEAGSKRRRSMPTRKRNGTIRRPWSWRGSWEIGGAKPGQERSWPRSCGT
jgi:predicted ATPase/transcriptional regulator with XRE-family HTH domain